jgi:methionyl-tRNA formyltransferase
MMGAPMSRVVLLTAFEGVELARLDRTLRSTGADVAIVRDLAGLEEELLDEGTTLLSFGTGVIVPVSVLSRLARPAYNLHAASPEFPGRDPHHFAVYQGTARYGATLHVMTEKVDAGPIVAVEMFDVAPRARPGELLALANEAGMRLIERCSSQLVAARPMPSLTGLAWGPRKRTRRDFLEHCRLPLDVGLDEFEHRFRAFDGEARDNLVVELHGWTFRIDKKAGRKG